MTTKRKQPTETRELFVANPPKPKVELRDYFLAAALEGLCANPHYQQICVSSEHMSEKGIITTAQIVRFARIIADEMLLERER